MGKVIAEFAMSLDGFIADRNDGVWSLYGWLIKGDTPFLVPSMGQSFMTSPESAAHFQEIIDNAGSLITGRRDFDVSHAWGGKPPYGVPTFIVSHSVPDQWAGADSPFTFVTEGVERAVMLAREAAGDKNVLVGGSQIVQQALNQGLIEELHINLVPLLLGDGIPLFTRLGNTPIELEAYSVVPAPGVTHLKYRVIRS